MLLFRLIDRGDDVSVQNGQICIFAHSGRNVPDKWLEDHRAELAVDLAVLDLAQVLLYDGHSVGRYGPHRWPGLTIDFRNLGTKQRMYTIFNVEFSRARTTKFGRKGDDLPRGSFRIGKRSALLSLWEALNLDIPPRLSSFHCYLGNLRERLMTFDMSKGAKIQSTSLRPLNLSCHEIRLAVKSITDKSQTNNAHFTDNRRTTSTYKQSLISEENHIVASDFTSCASFYDKSNQEGRYKQLNDHLLARSPMEQSDEEWLAEYDRAIH